MILLKKFSLLIKQVTAVKLFYLRVYNAIVTTIGRGNCAILFFCLINLLLLTSLIIIILFCILEKYVGISRNALTLIN